jgi:hypothetical protein
MRSERPLLYTAQDLARFCEVDLKTIHHWADGGKIPHFRTEGRHLRFRHNHLVRFLRSHGYPLHPEILNARPLVFYAAKESDDIVKKLGRRFVVRRFDCALAALLHIAAEDPDALVVALDDPTWSGATAIAALKQYASWVAVAAISDATADSGADIIVTPANLSRLTSELTEALGVE